MPWFRVDDDAGTHPKLLAAGDSAVGLWVRAGAYSARYLTEGHITRRALRTLGGTQRQVQRLLDARLWVVDPDGDGWRFWQWEDRQPTREDVEADRAAARERARRYRASRRDATVDNPGDNGADGPGPRAGRAPDVHGTRTGRAPDAQKPDHRSDVSDDVSAGKRDSSRRESRDPGPARPGPTHLLNYLGRLALGDARDNGRPPADQMSAWQELAGPHVDLVREAATYLARHGGRPADDAHAAWLGWLRTARKRADREHPAPIGCDRCHGGWLDDDPDTGRPRPCPTCKPRHLAAVETREDIA